MFASCFTTWFPDPQERENRERRLQQQIREQQALLDAHLRAMSLNGGAVSTTPRLDSLNAIRHHVNPGGI